MRRAKRAPSIGARQEGKMQFTARHILTFATEKDGLRIIGPFETVQALSAWGDRWQADNGDDPRWQQIELKDDPISVFIEVEEPGSDDD
jgi:hypothetical protein